MQRIHWSRASPALVDMNEVFNIQSIEERERNKSQASGKGMRRILGKLHTFPPPEILSGQNKQLTDRVEMKFFGTRGRYLLAKTA